MLLLGENNVSFASHILLHSRASAGYDMPNRPISTVDPGSAARRVLRVDRVTSVEIYGDGDGPPDDLDAVQTLEEHLSQGWHYAVGVVIDAATQHAAHWLRRSIGRLEPIDAEHCRLIGSTDEPHWYVEQIVTIRVPFHILGAPELQDAAVALGNRLIDAGTPPA